jgi:RHS repeat-associated protein
VGAGGGGSVAQTPPAIASSTPADGSVVTAPTAVSAGITAPAGQSIASWTVTLTPATGGRTITIGSGTGAPPPTLATLDPTLLPNGVYAIAVSAAASGSGTQTVTTSVSVAGKLKLGRFVSTYLDLNVPVNGFLMQVRRFYDSADKSNGDFGIGWHLSVSTFRVRSNRALGDGGWSEYPTSCLLGLCSYGFRSSAPHFATVTFPDGHDEIFDFTPAGGGVLTFWQGTASFTARQGLGITSTLAVAGDQSIVYNFDGNLYDSNFNPYNPTRLLLTTRDGRQILLDVGAGLVSETDRNGNTLGVDGGGLHSSSGSSITFSRDGQGRITGITGPSGQQLAYTYSSAGDLSTFRDANGNTFTLTYDASDNLLGVTGPGSTRPLQQQVFDPNTGRLSQVIDGSGNVTQVTDDIANHMQTIVDANGSLTTVETFDDLGDLVKQAQVFAGRTLTTTFTYDAVGRELSRTDPLGHTSSGTYDASGNLTSTTDADGNTTTLQYDAFGQLIAAIGPGGLPLLQITRDSHGNVVQLQRGDGTSYFYRRDKAGHMTAITDPSGRTEQQAYNASGQLTQVTDPAGNVTTVQFNGAQQGLGMTDARPSSTSFTYDADGNLTSITDGNGRARQFTYDAFGHQLSETDPLGRTKTFQYDPAGRLDSQTDRDGRQIAYTYDVDGKLATMVMPGNDVTTIAYDPIHRPTSLTNATATVQLQYDDAGRVTAQTSTGIAPVPAVTLHYAYDNLGLRTQLTGPEGSTSYRYDGVGRLTGITDPAQGPFTFGYSAASQLTTLARPNGVTDTLTFSGSDLTARTAARSGLVLAGLTYMYTVNGLRASATANGAAGPTTYGYDVAGQLVSASSGGTTQTWAYDAGGNIVSSRTTPVGGYSYDAAERLIQDAQNTYTYDHEGDMLTRTGRAAGAMTSYDWNARHQLLAIHLPDGSTEHFGYDPLGRRVTVTDATGVRAFVYDGDAVDLEYDGAGNRVASYTNGLGKDDVLEMARGGHRYFYLKDGLNSTVALTDETGTVAATYAYDAFGAPSASTGAVANPFTYTGREYDAHAGLLYLRSRYYDPHLARFLSEDPVLHPNPYPYVDNDPTNRRDPSGAQSLEEEEETLAVNEVVEEEEVTEEAQLVRQYGQMHADLGKEHLLSYLRSGQIEALQRLPWLERMYLGTAIHNAVAADLETLGFAYSTVGPDFAIGDLLIELTTESAVAAHIARGGLYLIAEIVTYVLEL